MPRYGICTVCCPGLIISIIPAQVHIAFELLLSAGLFPIITVGLPGIHGDAMTGEHGCGVKTPNAAAVALETAGFAIELHMPNVGKFTG